jgi:hypothetical protein
MRLYCQIKKLPWSDPALDPGITSRRVMEFCCNRAHGEPELNQPVPFSPVLPYEPSQQLEKEASNQER